MKRTSAKCYNNRQLGPHGRGGTFSSILTARPAVAESAHHGAVPQASQNMEEGVRYEPSSPGMMKKRERHFPRSESLISGHTHQTIPEKVLNLDLVFSNVEPGNIVPRRYLTTIVEPVSADEEKHPIPKLSWWHKSFYDPRPLSYSTDLLTVPTEGEERNPFYHMQNPRTRFHTHHMKVKNRANKVGGSMWIRGAAWWRKGSSRTPKFYTENIKRSGQNPWTSAITASRWVTDGKETLNPGTTPHYAFWKFLPVLGWNGYGTKKGEIAVEDSYTTVGLDQIQWWVDTGMLNVNETITPNTLIEAHLIEDYHWPGLKLVTNKCSWFNATLDIQLESADEDAVELVRSHGGNVVTRWQDEEGITKEKLAWRFPVIGKGDLPPEELIRDLYAKEERGGYMSTYYQDKLRVKNLATPKEWTRIEQTAAEVGELPPVQEEQVAQPPLRAATQVSLQRKQETWDDMLSGKMGTADSRMGLITQTPFPLWEYTYYDKQGPGNITKREPPEGQEVVQFPGYPMRDSRYFNWTVDGVGTVLGKKQTPTGTAENVYETTDMERVAVKKKMPWELKGEGWRTAGVDGEVRYRNPYNNPYLKARIDTWNAKQKEKKARAKKLGLTIPKE